MGMKNSTDAAKNHIATILQENKKLFTEFTTQRNLTERWNLENARAKDYHGRELLELLQNVDDAYEELCQQDASMRGKEVEAFIEYDGNMLRVQNNGTTFNEDSINRLCQGGISGKKKYYIGNKGIGFRSILNWASEIRLYSGDYAVRFSEDYAAQQLEEIRNCPIVQKELEENPDLRFPILYAPEFIEKQPFDFDTTIEIIVKPEALNDDWNIDKQIAEFDPYILLFLPNITKITFKKENKIFSFTKTRRENNGLEESVVQKCKGKTPEPESEEGFYVFNNDSFPAEIKNKEGKTEIVKLAVAVPSDFSQNREYNMYTFFPIRDAKSPFHALLHATFILSQNRDAIINSKENQSIFKALLEFYVRVIAEYFCKKEFGLQALKLMLPNKFLVRYDDTIKAFDAPFDNDNLIKHYLKLCRSQKVFFTVNGEFIAAEDKPKVIEAGFPKQFKGEPFKTLLADGFMHKKHRIEFGNQTNTLTFIKKLLGECDFRLEDLSDAVNTLSDEWTPLDRCEVFNWWINSHQTTKLLPHLLKDNNGTWITGKETVYLHDENAILPSWANCVVLDPEEEKTLIEWYKQNDEAFEEKTGTTDREKLKKMFGKNYLTLFSDYNALPLMQTLNKSVGDDYERALDFAKWLKQNYSSLQNANLNQAKLRLPTAENTVLEAEKLYFTKEWKNELGEPLFNTSSVYKKLCLPQELGVTEETFDDWHKLFERCGVQIFPKMVTADMTSSFPLYQEFQDAVKRYSKSVFNKGYYVYLTYFYYKNSKLSVPYIENLGKILETIPLKSLLHCILKNNKFYMEILTETHDAKTGKDLRHDTSYPCYLNFIFKNAQWFEINGRRYAPRDLLISEETKFEQYIPCISTGFLEDLGFSAGEIAIITDLLRKLGAAGNITTLSSSLFYTLLKKLGENEESSEFSKQIYREILEEENKNLFGYSDEKHQFLSIGKLWTKNAGWQPVSEVYFSSDAVLNLSNKPLLDLPFHIGNAKLAGSIFGVQEYKENFVVESYEISPCQNQFQKYFQNFLPYAICHAQGAIDDAVAQSLRLEAVEKITLRNELAEDSESISDTPLYSLLQHAGDKNIWLLYVGTLSFDDLDMFEVSKQIEYLFSKLGIEDETTLSAINSCFLHDDERERKYHLDKITATALEELAEWKEKLDIVENEPSEEESAEIPIPNNISVRTNPDRYLQNHISLSPQFDYEREYESDEKQGDRAEQLVVRKLRKREIPEICEYFDSETYSVNWVSSASKRFENNMDYDETCGYDVQLVSKSGKQLLVEIKSYWHDDIMFYLSEKELECATANQGAYLVVFVGNRKSENPSVQVLPSDFWKNAGNGGNDNFSFETSQYRVKKIR